MATARSMLGDLSEIVREAEPLARHTWFRLGGPAEFFVRPQTIEQLQTVVTRCRAEDCPLRILGEGSNILVDDGGVSGVVLHLESPNFSDLTIQENRLTGQAAVPLTALISQAARAGLAGLETLTGIPGTVGGAVRNNSGARQEAIGQFVRRVHVLDDEGEIQVRDRDDLNFTYRESNLIEPVTLSVEFELGQDDPEMLVRRMRRIWIAKKENQPYSHQSTACVFKSPTPELSASLLLQEAGVPGMKQGGAEVSDRHANYIVTHPGATSTDVLTLIDQIRDRVLQVVGQELQLQLKIWA